MRHRPTNVAGQTRRHGFTLIEILVATVIIVSILGMAYGSYVATSRSTHAYEAKMESSLYGYQTLGQMTRQLRCVYIPEQSRQTDADTSRRDIRPTRAQQNSDESDFCLFKGDPADSAGLVLQFVTTHALPCARAQDTGLYEVVYKYDRLGRALLVAHGELNAVRRQKGARRWDVLAEHVTDVDLKFHDGKRWLDTWDLASDKRLPAAVRIELAVEDRRGAIHRYSTAACPTLAASQEQVSTRESRSPDET